MHAMHPTTRKLLLSLAILVQVGVAPAQSGPAPDSYKITPETLERMREAGAGDRSIANLAPLVNRLYSSRDDLDAALRGADRDLPPAIIETAASHSRLDRLVIQSDEFSGDLQAGEAVFKGSVSGALPRDNITFTANKVRILTDGTKTYNRILAEGEVDVRQWDRVLLADHAQYNRSAETLKLVGNVVMRNDEGSMEGSAVDYDGAAGRAVANGEERAEGRLKLSFKLRELDEKAGAADPAESVIHAKRATVNKKDMTATFEGDVHLYRAGRELHMTAGKVVLTFNEDKKLVRAQAEQKVCIQQPGRVARANKASFDEPRQLILMEGDAEMHNKGRAVTGETIQLFLDVDRGEARGSDKHPIRVVLNLDETAPAPPPFRCVAEGAGEAP